MRQHAERRGDRAEAGRQAHDQGIEPDQNQHEHHRDGEDERGDLVAGDARRPDADGGEPRDQERGADVLRHEHPDREMRSQGEAEREGERHGQRDHEDRQLTEVLAGQKLELRDGLRQHDLERAAARVLGEGAHRHGGREEQEQPGQQVEHGAQRRHAVHVHFPEEEEAVHAGEHDQQDVRRGVIEQRLELASRDRQDGVHASLASRCVSWWNSSSRPARSACSSYNVHPRALASA